MNQGLSPEALAAIDKVQKLLALARDERGNENEASNALEMAQIILERHNLDMALVERQAGKGTHARREDKKSGGGLYKWQREVWHYVAELNFCKYFAIRGLARGAKYENRVVGRPENVMMTTLMAEYLQDAIERMAAEWAKDRGYHSRFVRDAIIYREGMADTIGARLRRMRYEREAEEKRKQEEAAAQARHPGYAGQPGTALVLASVKQNEDDLNTDYLFGYEPGTTGQKRAEREAAYQAWLREEERKRQEHLDRYASDDAYAAECDRKEAEDLAERQARERAAAKKSRHSRSVGGYRRENAEDRRRNSHAYSEGQDRGHEVGLDPQIAGNKGRSLK